MRANPILRNALAAIAASCAFAGAMPAAAQTVGSSIVVGINPQRIAVNPITNRVYVSNADSDTVSVINGATGAVITNIAVGDYPRWIAVDAENNKIYVGLELGGDTYVIDGATNVATPLASGGGGAIAITPHNGRTYVQRDGMSDEVNTILNAEYILTSATKSFGSGGLAVNPTNNWGYTLAHIDGDIVAIDLTTATPYPPLKCPNGSGGFEPQPPDETDPNGPCIDVPGIPVGVAINPVTNRIYAISDSGEISTIVGTNSTFTSVTPSLTGGRAIAVNPVTNKVYAAYSDGVAIMDGASGAVTTIAAGSGGGGPVAIGINVHTNMIYVPSADGTLLVINGATGASSTVAIEADAIGITVNPITNMVYVVHTGGTVTPVSGAAGSATSTGITTTISALPGGVGGTNGSITLNASSSMSPAPLNTIRRVYYRIDGGAWTLASGSGPFSAAYAGLSDGSHTIDAFATNSLEAPNANTDLASVPVVGNIASYTFTVDSTAVPTAKKKIDFDFNGKGDLLFANGSNVSLWLMNGVAPTSTTTVSGGGGTTVKVVGDFDGNGTSDILWRAADGTYTVHLMSGSTVGGSGVLLAGGTGWEAVGKGDFNGDGKTDLMWKSAAGQYGIWLMNGTGTISKGAVASPGIGWDAALVGDYNADGKSDILWRHGDGRVLVYIQNGHASSASGVLLNANTGWTPTQTADFDGDGMTDLIWKHNNGSVGLWLMNGPSVKQYVSLLGSNTGWTISHATDLNGDGKSDLVWYHTNGQQGAWVMNGTSATAYGVITAAGDGWTVVATDDLNGDGKGDLIFRNADGSYRAWLMNGLSMASQGTLLGAGTGFNVTGY